MKVIYNRIIPFKDFCAINLFGVLFVRNGDEITEDILNHETIHTAQIKELLGIFFYLLYLIEFTIRLFQYFNWYKAYQNISFEREAYANQGDREYLESRKKFQWVKYL